MFGESPGALAGRTIAAMRISIALVTLAALCGCGFKGPLYLPARTVEGAKVAAPPARAPVTTDEQRPVPAEAVTAPK